MALRKTLLSIHRRLLPDDPQVGWSPYLWLLYLAFLGPQIWHDGLWSQAALATLASLPPFLFLYFRAYWHRGRSLLLNLCAIAIIGALLLPLNSGASVYFIYAGAPAAMISTPLTALATLTALAAVLALESILLHLHLVAWLVPCFILMLVGVSNIFYCEMGRKNARLRLSQKEVSHLAAVAERERIARDLHDLLGQSLSLITIKAELAGRLFDLDPDRSRREIKDLERVSREALQEVRKAVSGFRHAGWSGELKNTRLALKAAGVKLQTDIADIPLTLSQETVLAMVLREAVTNIIRHAHAQHCQIELSLCTDELQLCIQDDGRGGRIVPGNGLSGMRERIEQLNGHLLIESKDGTRLCIHLPVEPRISPLQPWHHAA